MIFNYVMFDIISYSTIIGLHHIQFEYLNIWLKSTEIINIMIMRIHTLHHYVWYFVLIKILLTIIINEPFISFTISLVSQLTKLLRKKHRVSTWKTKQFESNSFWLYCQVSIWKSVCSLNGISETCTCAIKLIRDLTLKRIPI